MAGLRLTPAGQADRHQSPEGHGWALGLDMRWGGLASPLPPIPQTKLLTQYVLSLAKYDQNYDIRDRARFTRQLIVPTEQGGTLSRHAKKIFLAPKPAPVLESSFKGVAGTPACPGYLGKTTSTSSPSKRLQGWRQGPQTPHTERGPL